MGKFPPPKNPSRKVLLEHLSRMGELLNTLRNVHGGARAPRGAPRAPPGPPSGGGPRGGPGGVPDPLPGTPSGGVLWGGVRPPRAVRTQRAGSQDRPPPERSLLVCDDPDALSLVWHRIIIALTLSLVTMLLRSAGHVGLHVELHSMSRSSSLWRSEDTTCPQLKPRLAGLASANPDDVERRGWQSSTHTHALSISLWA